MSIPIIRKRERIETKTPYLSFDSVAVPGSGFSFDCVGHDPLKIENETAKANYAMCLKEVAAGKLRGPFKGSWVSKHIEPAVARCSCGSEVTLSDPLDNECDGCHRWYNMSGQEVVDPHSSLGRELREEDDRNDDGEY